MRECNVLEQNWLYLWNLHVMPGGVLVSIAFLRDFCLKCVILIVVLGKVALNNCKLFNLQRPYECTIRKPSSRSPRPVPTTDGHGYGHVRLSERYSRSASKLLSDVSSSPTCTSAATSSLLPATPSVRLYSKSAINIQCKFQMVKWGREYFSLLSLLMSRGMQRFADICLHRTKMQSTWKEASTSFSLPLTNPWSSLGQVFRVDEMSHTNHKHNLYCLVIIISVFFFFPNKNTVPLAYYSSFEEIVLMINCCHFHSFLGWLTVNFHFLPFKANVGFYAL